MTGRGIDQILRFPSDSRIYEPYIHHSEDYIRLAEQVNGTISTPVGWEYIWGDAVQELNSRLPDVLIVNLETAVTRSREPWPEKAIQYKMEPRNIPCISDVIEDQVPDDSLLLLSVHWGANWRFSVPPPDMQVFAHECIDQLGVDIIHGHSSHHPKALEVYKGKPILYGCGDFINDYEGIRGHERYRGDLALMYFLDFDTDFRMLQSLHLVPLKRRRFRLEKANDADVAWLADMLVREGHPLGTTVEDADDFGLHLKWNLDKTVIDGGTRGENPHPLV